MFEAKSENVKEYMDNQINPFEWGKLVSSLDGLARDVVKLETKIDIFLKEAVTRREFDDLKDDVNDIADKVRQLKSEQDRNQWISRGAWAVVTAIIVAAVAYTIP